jgi:hypothetical protein
MLHIKPILPFLYVVNKGKLYRKHSIVEEKGDAGCIVSIIERLHGHYKVHTALELQTTGKLGKK